MVVRMRKNRSQTRHGRSHHALKEPTLSTCSHCGEHTRPHHMCLQCGYYNGRQVIDLEAQNTKREARLKEKQEQIKAENTAAEPVQEETQEQIDTQTAADTEAKAAAPKARAAKAEQSAEKREESEKHSGK